MDGEERERKMIDDQIARARAAAGAEDDGSKDLKRAEGETIKLSLSLGPKPTVEPEQKAETAPEPGKLSLGSLGSVGKTAVPNPLKAASSNPLKRAAPGNIFKSAKTAKTETSKAPGFMSESERLMKEDQARKANRGGYQGAGPRRGDARRY